MFSVDGFFYNAWFSHGLSLNNFERSSLRRKLLMNEKRLSHINSRATFLIAFYSTCNFEGCSFHVAS